MPISRLIPLLAIMAAGILVAPLSLSAATLYQQNFVGISGNLGVHNWLGYQSATAIPVTSTSGSYRAGSINNNGLPDTPGPPASASPAVAGYIFAQNYAISTSGTVTTAASNYFLHMNTTLPTILDLDGYSSLNIQWHQSASNSNTSSRLAIQLDNGSWYVTNNTNTGPGSQGNTTFSAFNSNILTQNWYSLDFAPSFELAVDTSSLLNYNALTGLGSNITAVGIYIDSLPAAVATSVAGGTAESYITLRLDAITITGDLVPEPTRALLLSFALCGLLLHRRRS
ncbi:PEP-CTERM sorting domain-containing protein [Phragmitibacter flavus]|uniref:PEP-CTERM sorting domain-containing protein n=1 Tax=Phragmitibacter flavus TaxID=2576071 RepID=A0A5R8KFV5_9BACT|nr:PEP-CTERM sorting domain-containing protein [Phragmitibacter flavus]TLD71192.1 PEP-CTERM sorting domain-containing protein [Phragmitibacter flavus]